MAINKCQLQSITINSTQSHYQQLTISVLTNISNTDIISVYSFNLT